MSIRSIFFIIILFIPNIVSADAILKVMTGWEIDSIRPGMVWYQYNNRYKGVNQSINVLEIDFQQPEYRLEVVTTKSKDILSNVASKANAIAAINGTWGVNYSFIKSEGSIVAQPSRADQNPENINHWRFEGALFFNNTSKEMDIEYGTPNEYFVSTYPNIITAAPVLVNKGNPVGVNFVGDISGVDLTSLPTSDYRRHQGMRHPRTAIGRTEDGRVLLITVDGRQTHAVGMTAKELTEFLTYFFDVYDVLNLDGGGSTVMYIKDQGGPTGNDIISSAFDEDTPNKQRLHVSFILVHHDDKLSSVKSNPMDIDINLSSNEDGFTVSSSRKIQEITLYNLSGQQVNSTVVNNYQTTINNMQTSMYICKIKIDDKLIVRKIII